MRLDVLTWVRQTSRQEKRTFEPGSESLYRILSWVAGQGSFVLERAASHFNGSRRQASLVQRCASDPKVRLEGLLGKLNFSFTKGEEEQIQQAFHCGVCKDATTTCHQIRAVYDAFHLSW